MSTMQMDERPETVEPLQSVQSKTKQRIGLVGLYVRFLNIPFSKINHPFGRLNGLVSNMLT